MKIDLTKSNWFLHAFNDNILWTDPSKTPRNISTAKVSKILLLMICILSGLLVLLNDR